MEETLETESDISTAKDEDRGPIELLDDLAANLPGRGNSKKHSLFELVRSHYKSEADFKTLKLVPTHELVSAIYPAKGLSPNELKKHITLKKKTFSSLKSSLNKTLRTLSETGLNPSGIVLNKLNLFTFSSNLEESKLPKSVEEPLLKKMSNLLSKEGMELKSDVEKKNSYPSFKRTYAFKEKYSKLRICQKVCNGEE
ncbi:MAG: hypothetical protein ACE5FU_10935 [Nitrospinota bacterium]